MGKFLAVFKREYLERVRTRAFIISTVFGPVFFAALMVVPAWMSARTMRDARVGRVEILDVTGVGLGRDVQSRLLGVASDTSALTVRDVAIADLAAAESTATASVIARDISGYVVLDSATIAGSRARYAGRDASSVGEMEMLEGAIRQSLLVRRLQDEGLDPAHIEQLTRVRVQLATERITDKGRGGSGTASTVLGLVVAVLLYFSLVIYGQNMLRSVIEEKTTRVAEVLVASTRPDVLLAGKVVGVAAVGLTQQVIWLGSAAALFTWRVQLFERFGMTTLPNITLPSVGPGMIALLLAFFVLGFLFYSSLFAAAGAMVNSEQEAGQVAGPVIMLLVFSMIFLQPVLLAPDSTLAQVLSWVPFSAPIVMPLRMSVTQVSPLEMAGVLGGLVAASAAAIWVSARIYRVGLLMYGKRPSLREVGRWIMQS